MNVNHQSKEKNPKQTELNNEACTLKHLRATRGLHRNVWNKDLFVVKSVNVFAATNFHHVDKCQSAVFTLSPAHRAQVKHRVHVFCYDL